MKKLVLALAVVAFTVASSFAQHDSKSKAGKKHHKRNKAIAQLNLSDAQKAQMQANRADFKKEMKAVNSNENQTVKQLRDQRAALAKGQKAKMESLLTNDQKIKMAEVKTQANSIHRERFAKHIDKMKQELSLSDNQVAALQRNHEASKRKLKAIKDNDQPDRAAKKEQMKAMKNDMKNNLASVLTKAQMEQMESRKTSMKGKMKNKKMGKKAVE